MIKAIFFDTYNVLLYDGFAPGIQKYERKHSIVSGKLYTSAHDRPYWRAFSLGNISEGDYFSEIQKDFQQKLDIRELKSLMYQHFSANTELLKYAATLKKQFLLGVISNSPKELFDYCRKQFRMDEIFSVNAVSGYVHARKPDKKIFQYALTKASVQARESIYIDDRPDRVQGAQALGMNILIFKNNEDLKNNLKKI